MTTAYWTILGAILLPLLFTGLAKFTGGNGRYNNAAPREFLDNQTGAAKRAHWAQLNSFEALPGFVAAVLVAHAAGAAQPTIDALAITWLALRLAYGVAYIQNWPTLRSLLWAAALGCVIGLFVAAA